VTQEDGIVHNQWACPQSAARRCAALCIALWDDRVDTITSRQRPQAEKTTVRYPLISTLLRHGGTTTGIRLTVQICLSLAGSCTSEWAAFAFLPSPYGVPDGVASIPALVCAAASSSRDGDVLPESEPDVAGLWADRLSGAAAERYENEAGLRHGLYTVLGPYLTSVVGLAQSDIRHELTSTGGRCDSLFGRALFEYKTPGLLDAAAERRKAAEQSLRYLTDAGLGAVVVIITDGSTWGILRDTTSGPEEGEQGWLDLALPVPETPEQRFQWRPNDPDAARRVLDLLQTVKAAPVNGQTLIGHLGPSRTEVIALVEALADRLASRADGSRPDVLFHQWLQLAGVAYGIDGPDAPWPAPPEKIFGSTFPALRGRRYAEAVFTLHTYVALAAKCIAVEVLALQQSKGSLRPSQWQVLDAPALAAQIESLEAGRISAELRAPGLLGGDLFGWYAPLLADDAGLVAATRAVLRSFSELAWARLAHAEGTTGDLLRDFYAAVVPRDLRLALGEFFTPRWIAERVLGKSLELAGIPPSRLARILDPACGSGTFLVAALRRSLAAAAAGDLPPAEQTLAAIDAVHGFDINPVSPVMTRVNLLLALGDRVEALGTVRFNVYQADSVLLPETIIGQVGLDEAGAHLRIPLVIGDVDLPKGLTGHGAVTRFVELLEQSLARDRAAETFRGLLGGVLQALAVPDDEREDALDGGQVIYERLAVLKRTRRNGVWARVIQQAFAPRTLGTVDLVVGNPPWISWKNLPQAWQDRSEPLWRSWGLWQKMTRGSGIPLSDISTLLLARCLATYAPTGVVALLLPDSVLLAEPGGRALRRCILQPDDNAPNRAGVHNPPVPYRPVHVDDFSVLNPFPDAATRPVALYVRSGEPAVFPLPADVWTRTTPRTPLPTSLTWAEARARLTDTPVPLSPLDPADTASRWRPAGAAGGLVLHGTMAATPYRWGQGFHTRGADGLLLCEILTPAPVGPDQRVLIRSRPDLGRNTSGEAVREAEVEADWLWPLLRGRDVDTFKTNTSGLYAVLAHHPADIGTVATVTDLMMQAPMLYDYLEPWLDRLQNRSAYDLRLTPQTPWGVSGPGQHLRPDAHLVVTRYMHPRRTPPAAVCSPAADPRLGRVTTVYPNNKVNFISTRSREEADYLAGFVNSPLAQAAIARQASSTTIAPVTMNSLPIPAFDGSDPSHQRLAAIAARCSADPSEPALDELDQAVTEVSDSP